MIFVPPPQHQPQSHPNNAFPVSFTTVLHLKIENNTFECGFLLSETSEQTPTGVVAFGDPLSVYRSLFGGLELSSSPENRQKRVL